MNAPANPSELDVAPSIVRVLWWKRPHLWLAAMVVGFFVISVYSGLVGYLDFQLENPTDAGIITQAVASTAHGHVAPFFEYWDCLHKSRCSFLLVHPALILYVAVPFYQLAPSTVTLFVLRSAVIALAAIPLYWLTRQTTGSSRKALFCAGMFLVWAPTFAGDAFSLHLESLFPLELFSLVALWQAGRYRLAFGVAGAAFLTYEVSPLFVFLVGLFFLAPYVERILRRLWRRWRSRASSRSSPTGPFHALQDGWRIREIRYLIALLAASAAAYVVLSLFINVWGCRILSVSCPSVSPGIVGVFSNPSSPGFHSLNAILSSPPTVNNVEFWLILYALVGFLPLRSPRALILSLPWIGWTFLTISSNFTVLGREYTLIAAGPIFIGLAYGLVRIPSSWIGQEREVTAPALGAEPSTPADPAPARARRRPFRWSRGVWIGVVTAVVIANGLLMPIDPALSDLGFRPGPPFVSNYFHHSLEIAPGFMWVEKLLTVVPYSATVSSPGSLFPLIANYPHAYVPFSGSEASLPFNVSGGPQYVFVSTPVAGIGTNLTRNISNPALYGVRAYVGNSAIGPLFIYEQDYSLPAELFGPAPSFAPANYLPDAGLTVGPKGLLENNVSVPSGKVIADSGGPNSSGLVWSGPNVFLPAGSYNLTIGLAVTGVNLTRHPNQSAVRVEVKGFGGVALNETLPASRFVSGVWMYLSFNILLVNPIPGVDVEGYLESGEFSLAVASVSIEPSGE